mmetsp:Transcript_45067/g.96153  ORF Transcript_45067/g.96153 Transcript_45067/m.96153 type:complete len:328 (+) Transcript_45067:489-1472(+)
MARRPLARIAQSIRMRSARLVTLGIILKGRYARAMCASALTGSEQRQRQPVGVTLISPRSAPPAMMGSALTETRVLQTCALAMVEPPLRERHALLTVRRFAERAMLGRGLTGLLVLIMFAHAKVARQPRERAALRRACCARRATLGSTRRAKPVLKTFAVAKEARQPLGLIAWWTDLIIALSVMMDIIWRVICALLTSAPVRAARQLWAPLCAWKTAPRSALLASKASTWRMVPASRTLAPVPAGQRPWAWSVTSITRRSALGVMTGTTRYVSNAEPSNARARTAPAPLPLSVPRTAPQSVLLATRLSTSRVRRVLLMSAPALTEWP